MNKNDQKKRNRIWKFSNQKKFRISRISYQWCGIPQLKVFFLYFGYFLCKFSYVIRVLQIRFCKQISSFFFYLMYVKSIRVVVIFLFLVQNIPVIQLNVIPFCHSMLWGVVHTAVYEFIYFIFFFIVSTHGVYVFGNWYNQILYFIYKIECAGWKISFFYFVARVVFSYWYKIWLFPNNHQDANGRDVHSNIGCP